MEFEIPILETKIDSDNLDESAGNVFGGLAGVVGLMAIVGIAKYAYGRLASLAGVSGNFDVPGV